MKISILKNELKNKRGSIELSGLLLLNCLFLILIFSAHLTRTNLIQQRQLYRTVLCIKSTYKEYEKLTDYISNTNTLIMLLNVGKIIPQTSKFSGEGKKAIQLSQQVYYVSFLKKLSSISYCDSLQKIPNLLLTPYEARGPTLKRDLKGLTIPDQNFQKLYFINPRQRELITFNVEIKNPYSALNVKSIEIKKGTLQLPSYSSHHSPF